LLLILKENKENRYVLTSITDNRITITDK